MPWIPPIDRAADWVILFNVVIVNSNHSVLPEADIPVRSPLKVIVFCIFMCFVFVSVIIWQFPALLPDCYPLRRRGRVSDYFQTLPMRSNSRHIVLYRGIFRRCPSFLIHSTSFSCPSGQYHAEHFPVQHGDVTSRRTNSPAANMPPERICFLIFIVSNVLPGLCWWCFLLSSSLIWNTPQSIWRSKSHWTMWCMQSEGLLLFFFS